MKNKSLKHAYFTLGLVITVMIMGSVGYTLLGFTTSEAIYQTIITMATVGFEEVHPLDADIVQSLRETSGMLYVEGDAADEEVLKLSHGPPWRTPM